MDNKQIPGSNPAFDSIYNNRGFDGQVTSDFLRLGGIPPALKKDLVNFSTADFDDFKASFIDYIKSVYPNDFNNFIESDLGIMLSELFAYLGTLLSFKADALAQENYIATAKTSEGLVKLLELIGISMRGPVPSKATAELVIDDAVNSITDARQCTIGLNDRVVDTVSTRDNLPLSFTLYQVDSAGNIDMQSPDITLTSTEFSDDVSGLRTNDGVLVLLEGKMQTLEGVFRTGVTNQTIDITLPSVVEGSIVVSASDGFYTEVENIWFASSAAKVFEKKYNEDFSCQLLFGDGTVGKSPAPGSAYKVFYRTGGGLRGNVVSGKLAKAVTLSLSFSPGTGGASYTNITAGTGGVDSQSLEEARRFGPMWFATQFRAVTAQDYTAFINKFRSIKGKTGKGLAVLRDNGSAGNMIDMYVLQKATDDHLERASYEFKRELLEYMNNYRMITDELTVVDGVVRTLDLVTTLYVDKDQKLSAEDIKQRVAGLIVQYFSTVHMDFGTPFVLADLINFIIKDPGVRFFSVENYPNDIYVDFNEVIQLNNLEINMQFV